ncbi:MAG: (4Fe-4S)-binding protein [SAR202 cluster bacterium]|jgi:pyruvate ferredoxin oxidoreductase delta subunit|nr:(4Fe-4S)-binding protein [Dehalococcoidia bacterium]MQG55332.1 (4Fe-4S)-binding protein [SAR202 cluster bacterium]|tara:strand:+ start:189058 stop:190206 length:1149 start_codon:yes stop_codon:yes gene_type:complete
MATLAVEVVYRGIFQRTLARNIVRQIVFAARKDDKIGTAFGRYSDSPERNGIPAKQFAIVCDTALELEESLAVYEASNVDVTINLDDTLCKGLESWAWYGLQPINELTRDGGTLIVTSRQDADSLMEDIHQKDTAYDLAIIPSTVSFSGLWVYKDDHTDMRVLGTLCKVCPGLVSLEAMLESAQEQTGNETKVASIQRAFDRTTTRPVEPGEGNDETPFSFDLPGWKNMEEGLVIRAIPEGTGYDGGEKGYTPGRSDVFKKWSTRSMRPVINFETCIKCTLCWLQCPDTCFDVTPDGLYDANMESCCGCGVCEAVCPVPDCVTMVGEPEFNDNASQWKAWTADKEGYNKWMTALVDKQKAETRTHGFHHIGGYDEEIKAEEA